MKRLVLFIGLLGCAGFIHAQEALDSRAKKHYTPEQIAQMPTSKLAKVNFYFNHSFELKRTEKCPACPDPDPQEVDITIYENQRQENNRVGIMEEKGRYRIILLSREEMNKEYLRIEQESISK